MENLAQTDIDKIVGTLYENLCRGLEKRLIDSTKNKSNALQEAIDTQNYWIDIFDCNEKIVYFITVFKSSYKVSNITVKSIKNCHCEMLKGGVNNNSMDSLSMALVKTLNKFQGAISKKIELLLECDGSLEALGSLNSQLFPYLTSDFDNAIGENIKIIFDQLVSVFNAGLLSSTVAENEYIKWEIEQLSSFVSTNIENKTIKHLSKRLKDIEPWRYKDIPQISNIHDTYIDNKLEGRGTYVLSNFKSGKYQEYATGFAIERYIEYLKGLIINDTKEKIQEQNDIQNKQTTENVNIEPQYDTTIFTSLQGFNIFREFQEKIPFKQNPNSEYADYSFLFDKLKKDNFLHAIKHKTIIAFLKNKYQIPFAVNGKYWQLKTSETKEKKTAYSICKARFQ